MATSQPRTAVGRAKQAARSVLDRKTVVQLYEEWVVHSDLGKWREASRDYASIAWKEGSITKSGAVEALASVCDLSFSHAAGYYRVFLLEFDGSWQLVRKVGGSENTGDVELVDFDKDGRAEAVLRRSAIHMDVSDGGTSVLTVTQEEDHVLYEGSCYSVYEDTTDCHNITVRGVDADGRPELVDEYVKEGKGIGREEATKVLALENGRFVEIAINGVPAQQSGGEKKETRAILHSQTLAVGATRIILVAFPPPIASGRTTCSVVISADTPSSGGGNRIGAGVVGLIVPETATVDYGSIRILEAPTPESEEFTPYEPPTMTEKLLGVAFTHLFQAALGRLPVMKWLLMAGKSVNAAGAGQVPAVDTGADLNEFDVVVACWLPPPGARRIRVDIPVQFGEDVRVGLNAYWENYPWYAYPLGRVPTTISANAVSPGLSLRPGP